MPTTDGSHEKTLAMLGVTQPEQLASLFAEIRARFDSESVAVHDEAVFKQFRDAWLGRKSGVLAGITDHWLKTATPELKPAVGAGLNQLRAHVDAQIEARRVAIESGADESLTRVSFGTLKENVDTVLGLFKEVLTLPGPRPTHSVRQPVLWGFADRASTLLTPHSS